MRTYRLCITIALALFVSFALGLPLSESKDKMMSGAPEIKFAGPLAFAPGGLLLVGDTQTATIFAIDTGDRGGSSPARKYAVEAINEKIAALLGTAPDEVLINDLAVNPESSRVYLSVSRGRGPDAIPVILRVDPEGKLSEVSLKTVRYSKVSLPNPPGEGRQRTESITDLAYLDGRVIVAGLSSEEFASRLRSIPFPFKEADQGTSVEIYHGSHGQLETRSPVRTFAPYTIDEQPYILAAYTCTPLVKFPLSDLKPGSHVKGKTVAELGNRNRPLDMVVYRKGGKDYILLANNSRGVMKIATEGMNRVEAITQHISGTAGLPYETIEHLKGVHHLDRLDKDHALLLVRKDSGAMNLETIEFP